MTDDILPPSPPAQLFYQHVMRAAGNVITVYKTGSTLLHKVSAPASFSELLTRLACDWALPLEQRDHPVRTFLVELDRREPSRLRPERRRERNLKALCLAYSFLSGELCTEILVARLQAALGAFFDACASANDLELRWCERAETLHVTAGGRTVSINVEPRVAIGKVVRNGIEPTASARAANALSEEPPQPAPKLDQEELQLRDNALGRIERVFVFWTEQVPYHCLRALLAAIPAQFCIVASPARALEEAALRQRLSLDGIDAERYLFLKPPTLDSRWARDFFLLATDAARSSVILQPTLELLPANQGLASDLVAEPSLKPALTLKDVHLPFEGGDLRAIGPWLFVGKYTFQSALNKLKQVLDERGQVRVGATLLERARADELPELLLAAFRAISGREVVLLGDMSAGPPPLAHLDTYATFLPQPNAKPVVVLADTRAALELLAALSDEASAECERAMLRVSLDPKELTSSSTHPVYRNTYMTHDLLEILRHGGLRQFIRAFGASEERAAVQARLDTTHAWLTAHGYRVQLVPALLVMHGFLSFWADKDGRAYLRTLRDGVKRNYNNALVEVFQRADGSLQRCVYVPAYGFLPLEARLREIYADLGYETVFIPFMWEAGWGAGAVNCLTSEERAEFTGQRVPV